MEDRSRIERLVALPSTLAESSKTFFFDGDPVFTLPRILMVDQRHRIPTHDLQPGISGFIDRLDDKSPPNRQTIL
jgi:hypothetical protein